MNDRDREKLRRIFDLNQKVKWQRESNEALRELQEEEDNRVKGMAEKEETARSLKQTEKETSDIIFSMIDDIEAIIKIYQHSF